MNIHKTFDSLSWEFLKNIMNKMSFPDKFIKWIMTCVSSSMYSVKINGSLEGYFKTRSGLRQKDTISPYLFVIAMEVFTACIEKYTANPGFKQHWKTKETKPTHITFADNVLLFCKGDLESIKLLIKGLNIFSDISRSGSKCY